MKPLIHKYKIEIRFGDIDSVGHVNNAIYLSYFEQARMGYFAHFIGQWNWQKEGVIVARNEIDYRKPLHLNDEAYVSTWIERVGTKSFTMTYQVYRMKDGMEESIAMGHTVLVCFNYETDESQPVPSIIRNLAEQANRA